MTNFQTEPTNPTAAQAVRSLDLPHGVDPVAISGPGERNLKIIREGLGVAITSRNGQLRVSGEAEAVARAATVLAKLCGWARQSRVMSRHDLLQLVADADQLETVAGEDNAAPISDVLSETQIASGLDVYLRGRRIAPKTEGQKAYVSAIAKNDLTFCCGPAGTGKTYLAVAAAVTMLKQGAARKIVLVRPAVEAGERLGFLPGSLQDKVNPYLRPLLDSLHDMMEFDHIERFMAADVIEIIPLAFMRGRTLNDAVIILDEAQNATRSQMLMFLTRLGHGSKMVVTGDTSQTDLEDANQSGLIDAVRRLRRTQGIAFVTLDKSDIVRHRLVQRIVEAYGDGSEQS